MGTNFYVRGFHHDPEYRIGRRSVAGLYCWDCGCTMCIDGIMGIHTGAARWHKHCHICGAEPQQEELNESSVGRELGFNKTLPTPKTGVASCSSFAWVMSSDEVKKIEAIVCPGCGHTYDDPEHVIEDEHGQLYTAEEFEQVLLECPIQFTGSIG